MNGFRNIRTRLTCAAALAAAATFMPVGGAAADPSDPVCIMPPEDYCTLYAGYQFGTRLYRECFAWASAQQQGEYCNPVDWGLAAAKLD